MGVGLKDESPVSITTKSRRIIKYTMRDFGLRNVSSVVYVDLSRSVQMSTTSETVDEV